MQCPCPTLRLSCLQLSHPAPHTVGRMFTALSGEVYTGLGAAAVLALAAGGCAYAAMWPGSQIFGRTLIAPARPGELALTFDDGPNPAWTPQLLDILAQYGVKAS